MHTAFSRRRIFAWIVLATYKAVISSAAESPAWNKQSVEALEDAHLSISCEVKGLAQLDVVRIVHIAGNQTTTVTDNDNVKFPFRKLPQYKVHYESDGNVGIIQLHYRGIKGSDTGSLGCYKLSDAHNMAIIHIKVLVPVREFHVISMQDGSPETRILDDASDIIIQSGDTVAIGCTVSSNSYLVVPELKIDIDGEDKSVDAAMTKTLKQISLEDGLTDYNTEVKMLLKIERVDHTLSRKKMSCTAKIEGYEEQRTSKLLKVRYSPVISCSQTNYHGSIGRNAAFSCNICSNPNPEVKWTSGDQSIVEHAVVMEKVLDNEECIQANMTVAELESSHFKTYILTASNELGVTTETIVIEEERKTRNNLRVTEEDLTIQDDTNYVIQAHDESNKLDETLHSERIQGQDGRAYSVINNSGIAVRGMYLIVYGLSIIVKRI